MPKLPTMGKATLGRAFHDIFTAFVSLPDGRALLMAETQDDYTKILSACLILEGRIMSFRGLVLTHLHELPAQTEDTETRFSRCDSCSWFGPETDLVSPKPCVFPRCPTCNSTRVMAAAGPEEPLEEWASCHGCGWAGPMAAVRIGDEHKETDRCLRHCPECDGIAMVEGISEGLARRMSAQRRRDGAPTRFYRCDECAWEGSNEGRCPKCGAALELIGKI